MLLTINDIALFILRASQGRNWVGWLRGFEEIVQEYTENNCYGGVKGLTPLRFAYDLYNMILEYTPVIRGGYLCPPRIAMKMVRMADLQPDEKVVDPCAGIGCLLKAAEGKCSHLFGYELQAPLAYTAKTLGFKSVMHKDFLKYPREEWTNIDADVVLFYPPDTAAREKMFARIERLYRKARVIALLPVGYFGKMHGKRSMTKAVRRFDIDEIVRVPPKLFPHNKKHMAIYKLRYAKDGPMTVVIK